MYYFAYGSNMLEEQMRKRCPSARAIARGVLRGWGLMINERGVATLSKEEEVTMGVIYHVTPFCVAYLDICEGVRIGRYGKFYLPVETFRKPTLRTCLVYIDPSQQVGAPRVGYLEKIIAGAAQHNLPRSYIRQLKTWKWRL